MRTPFSKYSNKFIYRIKRLSRKGQIPRYSGQCIPAGHNQLIQATNSGFIIVLHHPAKAAEFTKDDNECKDAS
jgi:hypothetical protein